MLVKETMHGIACDGCDAIYESSEGFAYFHLQTSATDMIGCNPRGWTQHEDKHYCPNCQQNNQ